MSDTEPNSAAETSSDIGLEIDRAVALRSAGQHTGAMAILLDLIKREPSHARLNYELAGTYDQQGLEADAIPFYEKSLALGLAGDARSGALLGLGSSYRCLEQYGDAVRTLEGGMVEFPDSPEFGVFLALALYNLGDHRRAMTLLLNHIAAYPGSEQIRRYQRAIHFYADRPDPPYEG